MTSELRTNPLVGVGRWPYSAHGEDGAGLTAVRIVQSSRDLSDIEHGGSADQDAALEILSAAAR